MVRQGTMRALALTIVVALTMIGGAAGAGGDHRDRGERLRPRVHRHGDELAGTETRGGKLHGLVIGGQCRMHAGGILELIDRRDNRRALGGAGERQLHGAGIARIVRNP